MQKTLPPGSHVLLILPEDSAASTARGEPTPAGELIFGGRRYQLVPVPPDEAPVADAQPAAVLSSAAQQLTARELQIVSLVAEGRVNKEIATRLSISTWTVSAHLRRIFAKLGVDTRAAMVSRCFGATAEQR